MGLRGAETVVIIDVGGNTCGRTEQDGRREKKESCYLVCSLRQEGTYHRWSRSIELATSTATGCHRFYTLILKLRTVSILPQHRKRQAWRRLKSQLKAL